MLECNWSNICILMGSVCFVGYYGLFVMMKVLRKIE